MGTGGREDETVVFRADDTCGKRTGRLFDGVQARAGERWGGRNSRRELEEKLED